MLPGRIVAEKNLRAQIVGGATLLLRSAHIQGSLCRHSNPHSDRR
jgi:hypothetical protein